MHMQLLIYRHVYGNVYLSTVLVVVFIRDEVGFVQAFEFALSLRPVLSVRSHGTAPMQCGKQQAG